MSNLNFCEYCGSLIYGGKCIHEDCFSNTYTIGNLVISRKFNDMGIGKIIDIDINQNIKVLFSNKKSLNLKKDDLIHFKFRNNEIIETKFGKGQIKGFEIVNNKIKYKLLIKNEIHKIFEDEIKISLDNYHMLNPEIITPLEFKIRLISVWLKFFKNSKNLVSLSCSRINFLKHQIFVFWRLFSEIYPRYILADEVGLGKTTEAGLLFKELKLRSLIKKTLIIAPANLVSQWQYEMKCKFNEEFKRLSLNDLRNNLHINYDNVICSLQSLRLEKELISNVDWDLIIFDEAHHLRKYSENRATKNYELAEFLSDKCKSLLLLTATPIQIYDYEFYALLDLLNIGIFKNYDDFKEFINFNKELNEIFTIINEKYENINLPKVKNFLNKIEDGSSYIGGQKNIGLEDSISRIKEKLKKCHIISDYLIRNRKRDVFNNLIKRKVKLVRIILSPEEYEIYAEITKFIREEYRSAIEERNYIKGFLMVTFQKMLTSSKAAILKSFEKKIKSFYNNITESLNLNLNDLDTKIEDYKNLDENEQNKIIDEILQCNLHEDIDKINNEINIIKSLYIKLKKLEDKYIDSKFDKLIEILNNIFRNNKNEKVIIFTRFLGTQKYLQRRLEENGYSVVIFNGTELTESDKNIAIENFKNTYQIMISTEVGGEGRNFQFCHIMINYDLPWNPMKIEQRIGRLDRIGQKKDVIIYNLFCSKTIEEKIVEVLFKRINIFESAIGTLDPILGEIEEYIKTHFLKSDDPNNMEKISEEINSICERIKEENNKKGSQIVALKSYDEKRLDKICKNNIIISDRFLINYINDIIEFYGNGCIKNIDSNYIIEIPRNLLNILNYKQKFEGYFDRNLAINNEEHSFFTISSSPILEFIEYFSNLSESGYYTHILLKSKIINKPGILFAFTYNLSGLYSQKDLCLYYIDEDGEITRLEIDFINEIINNKNQKLNIIRYNEEKIENSYKKVFNLFLKDLDNYFIKFKEKNDHIIDKEINRLEKIKINQIERDKLKIETFKSLIEEKKNMDDKGSQAVIPMFKGKINNINKKIRDFEKQIDSEIEKLKKMKNVRKFYQMISFASINPEFEPLISFAPRPSKYYLIQEELKFGIETNFSINPENFIIQINEIEIFPNFEKVNDNKYFLRYKIPETFKDNDINEYKLNVYYNYNEEKLKISSTIFIQSEYILLWPPKRNIFYENEIIKVFIKSFTKPDVYLLNIENNEEIKLNIEKYKNNFKLWYTILKKLPIGTYEIRANKTRSYEFKVKELIFKVCVIKNDFKLDTLEIIYDDDAIYEIEIELEEVETELLLEDLKISIFKRSFENENRFIDKISFKELLNEYSNDIVKNKEINRIKYKFPLNLLFNYLSYLEPSTYIFKFEISKLFMSTFLTVHKPPSIKFESFSEIKQINEELTLKINTEPNAKLNIEIYIETNPLMFCAPLKLPYYTMSTYLDDQSTIKINLKDFFPGLKYKIFVNSEYHNIKSKNYEVGSFILFDYQEYSTENSLFCMLPDGINCKFNDEKIWHPKFIPVILLELENDENIITIENREFVINKNKSLSSKRVSFDESKKSYPFYEESKIKTNSEKKLNEIIKNIEKGKYELCIEDIDEDTLIKIIKNIIKNIGTHNTIFIVPYNILFQKYLNEIFNTIYQQITLFNTNKNIAFLTYPIPYIGPIENLNSAINIYKHKEAYPIVYTACPKCNEYGTFKFIYYQNKIYEFCKNCGVIKYYIKNKNIPQNLELEIKKYLDNSKLNNNIKILNPIILNLLLTCPKCKSYLIPSILESKNKKNFLICPECDLLIDNVSFTLNEIKENIYDYTFMTPSIFDWLNKKGDRFGNFWGRIKICDTCKSLFSFEKIFRNISENILFEVLNFINENYPSDLIKIQEKIKNSRKKWHIIKNNAEIDEIKKEYEYLLRKLREYNINEENKDILEEINKQINLLYQINNQNYQIKHKKQDFRINNQIKTYPLDNSLSLTLPERIYNLPKLEQKKIRDLNSESINKDINNKNIESLTYIRSDSKQSDFLSKKMILVIDRLEIKKMKLDYKLRKRIEKINMNKSKNIIFKLKNKLDQFLLNYKLKRINKKLLRVKKSFVIHDFKNEYSKNQSIKLDSTKKIDNLDIETNEFRTQTIDKQQKEYLKNDNKNLNQIKDINSRSFQIDDDGHIISDINHNNFEDNLIVDKIKSLFNLKKFFLDFKQKLQNISSKILKDENDLNTLELINSALNLLINEKDFDSHEKLQLTKDLNKEKEKIMEEWKNTIKDFIESKYYNEDSLELDEDIDLFIENIDFFDWTYIINTLEKYKLIKEFKITEEGKKLLKTGIFYITDCRCGGKYINLEFNPACIIIDDNRYINEKNYLGKISGYYVLNNIKNYNMDWNKIIYFGIR
ncbi:MAG: SNF2-related protein [Candidatus Helarchaeota archaeon]